MSNLPTAPKPTEFGFVATDNTAEKISLAFKPMIDTMVDLEKKANIILQKPDSQETAKEAGELMKRYVKTRTGTARIHKEEKKYYLSIGKYVDAWKNTQLAMATGKEDLLREKRDHFKNIELKRIADLAEERTKELLPFTEIIPQRLGEMLDGVYEAHLIGVKALHKQEQEKEEARLKEEQRLKELDQTYAKRAKALFPYTFTPKSVLTKATTESEFQEILLDAIAQDDKNRIKQLKLKEQNKKLKKQAQENERKIEQAKVQAEILEDNRIREQKKRDEIAYQEHKEQTRITLEKTKLIEQNLARGDAERYSDLLNAIGELIDENSFESAEYQEKLEGLEHFIFKAKIDQ